MYVDKDQSGYVSMMELTDAEIKDIGCILFEFERAQTTLSDREKARLSMFSAKLRFLIVDELNHGPITDNTGD